MCARADIPAAAALEGLAKLHERRGQDAEALAAFEQAIAVRKSGNAGGGFLREIADGEAKLAALRERVHAHVGDFIKKTSPERVRAHSPTPPTFPLPANAVTRPHGPRAKALCTTMARMDAMMDDACLPPTAAAGAMAGACAAGGAAEAETIDDSTVADGVEAGADDVAVEGAEEEEEHEEAAKKEEDEVVEEVEMAGAYNSRIRWARIVDEEAAEEVEDVVPSLAPS